MTMHEQDRQAIRLLQLRPVAKGGPGGPGTPQAIQGIVNTVFLLYYGFNFSESNH